MTQSDSMWAVTAKDGPAPSRIARPARKSPEDVLVRVRRVGICGTDREVLDGYGDFQGVLGHEFVGEVVEADLYAWLRRRVTAHINIPPDVKGTVDWRRAKHAAGRSALGIRGRDGVMADYAVLPEGVLVAVPDSVTDVEAALAEPLAAAMDAVARLPMGSDPILLVGDGRLAQLAARLLRGYRRDVHAVGHHDRKLARLREIGVRTLDGAPEPRTYHGVLEMSGSPEGFATALAATAPEGTVVLKSTHRETVTLDPSRVVVDEIKLIGSRCGDIDRAVALLAEDAFVVEDLVDAVYPLRESEAAFARAFDGETIKVQLTPGDPD